MTSESILPQSRERYAREARLVRRDGRIALETLVWEAEEERHERALLDDELAVVGTLVLERASALVALTCADVPEVLTRERASEVDTRARAGGEEVRVERQGGLSRVVLAREGREWLVWEARATAMAPALARAPGGTWIAFHHNRREDTGEADLAKWIALRFVDDEGRVFEPEGEMLDRNRDRIGEEQGFEFPSLVVGADGAIALFGRGSHRFYRQDVTQRGYGPREPLVGDEGQWGCRGRRIAALLDGGSIVLARRDRRGVVLSRVPAPEGGAPRLVESERVLATLPHRDVPRRPEGEDPARAHGLVTLFGDIHQHSAHSDGCGAAQEPYLRARDVYGDDFAALSDHESFLGKRVGPGEWALLRGVADAFDDPGRFVALHAYEWTGKMFPGPGHKVVYPLADDHRVVSRDDEPTGEGLLELLRQGGGIAVPHHVGWTGADEAAHDERLQPVWEICSCHGCYLHAGHALGQRGELVGQMIEDVLGRGRRFGFIACSDGHGLLHHHGVARKRDPFRCGLTAVLAKERTREAILEAICARRTYATSGVPIFLDVRADGTHPMGSALSRSEASIRVVARAATPIRELAWVAPGGDVARVTPGACEGTLEARASARWGYARVVTEDGEMAWSSPIFLEG